MIRLTSIRQKAYFEVLDSLIDSPIYTTRNWRQGDNFKPGKQRKVGGYLPPIDHRSIGSNEVVIELDARSFSMNSKYASMISEYLNSQEIPHYNFWSGNKSIHMHIFLDIDIKTKEGQEIIKEAIKHGCNIYKEIRLKLAYEIIEQSGLNKDLIGVGKVVDLAKLKWNDLAGKNTLIRCCGGANSKVDPTGTVKTAYKTFLSTLPAMKPKPQKWEDVAFPPTMKRYVLNEGFVTSIAKKYMDLMNNPRLRKEVLDIDFEGSHTKLPCIRALIEGVEVGQRSFGAQQVAIAFRKDGKTEAQAKELIKVYVRNCSQVPEPFELDEAEHWVEWVYKLPDPYFACGLSVTLGVCEKFDCPYHKKKYEEELKVFDVEEPLELVKEVLDEMVIGEDKLKMQLFLIMLTKNFDPEWCVMIDGGASSGKSHTMKAVVRLFGEEDEDYFIYSRITGAVLNRIEEEAKKWQDSIVIIEEFQGTRAALEQLRVLISERKLKLLETAEDKAPDGSKSLQPKTTTIRLKNTLFVTCQAEDDDEGDQFISRSWILNTDTSAEQSKKIVEKYLELFDTDMKSNINEEKLGQLKAGIKTLITPDKIVFPFRRELFGFLPMDDVRVRRDIKKFVALIKASALFHQNKRNWYEKDGKNILVADWRDIKCIIDIAGDTLIATTQGMGEKDLLLFQAIQANSAYVPEFNINDVARWCKISIPFSHKMMSKFCKMGYFDNTTRPPDKAIYKATSFTPSFSHLELNLPSLIEKQDKELSKWLKGVKS